MEMVGKAVLSGVRFIQIRDKTLPKRVLFEEASDVRTFTKKYRAKLIINDYVDIARAVDADGVHLGQDDMPIHEARKILGKHRIIGISTHSLRQAVEAQRQGADYIGFGPIFYTSTKNAGAPKGTNALTNIKHHIQIPVVAIGGITHQNACDVFSAGADSIAVSSAILSGDIKKNAKKFLNLI
jgi:thiamine-phosphate pyrophosphorylase